MGSASRRRRGGGRVVVAAVPLNFPSGAVAQPESGAAKASRCSAFRKLDALSWKLKRGHFKRSPIKENFIENPQLWHAGRVGEGHSSSEDNSNENP